MTGSEALGGKPSVVVILSDKRSGSTWLEREICRHPDVRQVAATTHSHHETHYWVKGAVAVGSPPQLFANGKTPTNYGGPRDALDSIRSNLKLNGVSLQPGDNIKSEVQTGWEALCRHFSQPVFIEKSPHHIHHLAALELMLEWIEQTDMTVRVLGLVRNPMAVLHSAQQLFATNPDSRQWAWQRGCKNLEWFSRQLQPEQFKLVRFEDLVTKPGDSFKSVLEFIGVEHHPRIGASASRETLVKWKRDSDFQFQLHPEVAKFAQSLGYQAEELVQPPKPKVTTLRRMSLAARGVYRRVQGRAYQRFKRWRQV